ncbi:MAG: nucleotidyltransferase family protein [Pseudomonadota bacterium]
MDNVTAIVLAAGLSRRMGSDNKLLLPVNGEPMIVRTLRAYREFCSDVVVVAGFDAENLAECVRHLGLRLTHNPDFAEGQARSVATGLRAAQGAEHVMVGLGDQPALTRDHLDTLFQRHIAAGGKKITVPHNGTARGNPIVIPGDMIDQMLEDKQNPGCGKFTRERPDMVHLTPLQDAAFFHDVDTPEDYAALSQHLPMTEDAQ